MNEPLSPRSRDLVAAARRAHQAETHDVAAKVRVKRSLDLRIAALAAAGGTTLFGATLAKALTVTVLTAGVITGGVLVTRQESPPPARETAPVKRARPVPLEAPAATTPAPSDLSREIALLTEAQAALRERAPARALAMLERHAAEFPAGFMAAERQAARAVALCELGRHAEARTLAADFVRTWPASPLVGRMNQVCPPSSTGTPPGRRR